MLILVGLVLIGLAIAGFAGLGPFSDRRRSDERGWFGDMAATTALLIGMGLIVFEVVISVITLGLVLGGDDDGSTASPLRTSPVEREEPAEETEESEESESTAVERDDIALLASDEGVVGGGLRQVTLAPVDDSTFAASYEVVDALENDEVLYVRVAGFEEFAVTTAQQCVTGPIEACGNRLPVQFSESGQAVFQYQVRDTFIGTSVAPEGGCRALARPCTLVVETHDRKTRAQIRTVFGDTAEPPGTITVSGSRDLDLDGQSVTVSVSGYPAGVEVQAMLCAAPDDSGTDRCGAPGPSAPLLVGDDGTGSTELLVVPGPVGSEGVSCSRGDDCGITVASAEVLERATVVSITFAGPAGAAYDSSRLIAGLAIALVLVTIAVWLVRRTDWRPPAEAGAPEIDDAEYADLDAIVAAMPDEDPDDALAGAR